MSAWIVSPNGSSLNRRLRAIEESSHTSGNFSDRYALLGTTFADEEVDLAVVESLLADGEADGAPDQIRIRELLARALVAVVEEDGASGLLERGDHAVCDLRHLGAPGGERDHVNLVWSHRRRPGDPILVVVLLDDRGH